MKKFARMATAGAVAFMGVVAQAPSAAAGPDLYIGEVMLVPYNFCPRGTIEADGRLMQISQNQALFSLLGTTYGGDGRTSFGIPDLRRAAPASKPFDKTKKVAGQKLKYCIALTGIFPSRN